MSLEHFIDGASAGRESSPIQFLGGTGPSDFSKQSGQRNAIYKAERAFRMVDEAGGKVINRQGARDLVGEALFHPHMDEIPGIDKVRQTFGPDKVQFFKSGKDKRIVDAAVSSGKITEKQAVKLIPPTIQGAVSKPAEGDAQIFLRTSEARNRPIQVLRVGTATHEISHALLHGAQFQGAVGHHWPMARTHIHVVRALFGDKHARALKDYYDDLGVNFGG